MRKGGKEEADTEGESGWLPVAFNWGKKRLHLLYSIVAQRIKWETRGLELECGLRSGLEESSLD